mgnify:CR=1 FL=1
MLWTPDHCEKPPCVIEVDNATFAFQGFIQRCLAHQSINLAQQFLDLHDENTRKNRLLGLILENFTGLSDQVTDAAGNISYIIKPSIGYLWSFDTQRRLSVMLNTSAANKVLIQNLANSVFGADKVVVK